MWRFASVARYQARLAASVVAPAPPQMPVKARIRPPCVCVGGGAGRHDEGSEKLRHHLGVQRFVEVFADAQRPGELPVEIGVLPLADHQHADVGLDHLGQRGQRRHWLLVTADVHHQDARCRHLAHCRDCTAAVAAMHDDVFLRGVKQTNAQRRLGFSILDEGKHLGAAAATRC